MEIFTGLEMSVWSGSRQIFSGMKFLLNQESAKKRTAGGQAAGLVWMLCLY